MQIIQHGQVSKPNAGSIVIDFATPFKKIPHVVVSPYWRSSASQVGGIETVTAVSLESFTITSLNHDANNYYVSWIAVSEE
jgi:hypothetical protein